MFLLAFTSSMPLSLTIHPRVREAPTILFCYPAFLRSMPRRLRGIGFLMEPRETSFMPLLQEDQIGYRFPPPFGSWRHILGG